MRSFGMEAQRYPGKSPEDEPVVELSNEEVEEIEKTKPEEAIAEALPLGKEDERKKRLVEAIWESYLNKLPEAMPSGMRERKIRKAREIFANPSFQQKIKSALTSQQKIEENNFITSYANFLRDEVNNPDSKF